QIVCLMLLCLTFRLTAPGGAMEVRKTTPRNAFARACLESRQTDALGAAKKDDRDGGDRRNRAGRGLHACIDLRDIDALLGRQRSTGGAGERDPEHLHDLLLA